MKNPVIIITDTNIPDIVEKYPVATIANLLFFVGACALQYWVWTSTCGVERFGPALGVLFLTAIAFVIFTAVLDSLGFYHNLFDGW